ncbi:hypothetical protein [Devosia faecipullorum]|uniref:hypothetical protein n=1 Tax=Devosia faecipullorum TaxID=2755039 RepID=UPI00187B7EF1|nr:hypothetical protein [Devosia faecipullorum]MBE7734202.1 hypothetical protein [Devosia faecipullorum]
MLPLKYPAAKPARAWLITTGALLAIALPGSVWLERLWNWTLPPYGVNTLVALAVVIGLIPAYFVLLRQEPPEPGDPDYPDQ